jgi:Rrf2 family protein
MILASALFDAFGNNIFWLQKAGLGMRISARTRYGTRLLLDMARHHGQGPLSLTDISRRQNISLKYLEQIIAPLKRAGIVESFRGVRGGHRLCRSPKEITVVEVFALLEGSTAVTDCSQDPLVCERSPGCPMRRVWVAAAGAFCDKLSATTLEDLIKAENEAGVAFTNWEGSGVGRQDELSGELHINKRDIDSSK